MFVAQPRHIRRLIEKDLFQTDGVHEEVVWGYDLMCSSTVALYNSKKGAYKKVRSLKGASDANHNHASTMPPGHGLARVGKYADPPFT